MCTLGLECALRVCVCALCLHALRPVRALCVCPHALRLVCSACVCVCVCSVSACSEASACSVCMCTLELVRVHSGAGVCAACVCVCSVCVSAHSGASACSVHCGQVHGLGLVCPPPVCTCAVSGSKTPALERLAHWPHPLPRSLPCTPEPPTPAMEKPQTTAPSHPHQTKLLGFPGAPHPLAELPAPAEPGGASSPGGGGLCGRHRNNGRPRRPAFPAGAGPWRWVCLCPVLMASPSPSSPGLAPGRHGPSPGSEGALAAWPRCTPEKPEECGSSSPEPEAPPVPRLLPSPPLFVTLHADWNTAMADWGLAWEAHVYGAGSLFSLLALLSLLGLACLPVRCPAGCTFLAALDLLLLVAGTARAFLLFYDAYGQQERLPAFASLLLHDLPFPCLSSALAMAFLLLSTRSRIKLSHARFRHPGCLASLVLLHFFVAVGAVLAADLLRQFPFLLLVSRGAYALLAALLSLAFLAFYCLGRADTTRAAHTTLLAACFALLSAALQAYAVLHALGYGLPPGFFGPWPWWSLQLGCRLCEVGTGLPLALVGLYPLVYSHEPPCVHCWGTLFRGPVKAPVLPNNFQWAMAQHEKLVTCDTITRSDSEFLPLYSLAGSCLSADGAMGDCGAHSPGAARASETRLKGGCGSKTSSIISMAMDGDPTADFRPPSPINLRRSIDEALFSEALIPASLFQPAGTLASSSTLALSLQSPGLQECQGRGEAPASRGLYRTSSCMELETALPQGGDGEASLETSVPDTPFCSPGRWRGSSRCSSSPYGHSLDGSSLVLCPSLEQTTHASSFAYEPKLPQGQGESSPRRSPPPPGGLYLPLAQPSQESLDSLVLQLPAGDAALLQEEFVDVCRQIDALSVSSDTIDL
uniref:Proline rich transmembrane protein 4 n=1 Tax=Chelonoidis abingdonii TaxID=106734 RepID=A0A8C0J329_CHEAB